MIRNILLVALGGALGSVARYVTSLVIGSHTSITFPVATMLVNIVGCFIIGFVSQLAAGGSISQGGTKLFLTVGFCGGFTTFSTFCNESLSLMRGGHMILFAIYATASLFVGLLAVWGGMALARRLA